MSAYREPGERPDEPPPTLRGTRRARSWGPLAELVAAIAMFVGGGLGAGYAIDLGPRHPGLTGTLGAVFMLCLCLVTAGFGLGARALARRAP